nr:putative late blight resistance protein homolog R1A-3 isoform X2 [Ipomoea batatas]
MELKQWELADDGEYTFQVLERLVLRNCFELKEMPSWIENLNNLKSVQLEHCHASLVTSARTAKEQREIYGEGHGFEILADEDQKLCTLTQECFPRSKKSLHPTRGQSSVLGVGLGDSGHEVVVLQAVSWSRSKGKLDTRRLHENTSYSAYLIFKLEWKPYHRQLDRAFTYVRYIKNKRSFSENQRCQVFLTKRRFSKGPTGRFPNRIHDGVDGD